MAKSKRLSNKKEQEADREFYECIKDMLQHPYVQRMKNYIHHSSTDCYRHCVHVAYYNYRICRFFHLDARAAARAGMVHDLFLYDWRLHQAKTGDKFHAMTHPGTAIYNAKKYFDITPEEEDIMKKHMWPMTVIPPTTAEGVIMTFTDKFCGFCEFVEHYHKLPKRQAREAYAKRLADLARSDEQEEPSETGVFS
ncbi:MAG: phosphohydrolase [Lachnospiraceae bacterium]|nr:phosphohydrolase [Lachnospiraceae bacterium]